MKLPLVRFASRQEAVRDLRERLARNGWPRLQMLLLVTLTGASGFVASFAMLALGVERMGLRYLVACCLAYLCFLGLLWIWIQWRKGDSLDPVVEIPEIRSDGPAWQGDGGRSGGGGASANWNAVPDASGASLAAPTPVPMHAAEAPSSSGFDLPDVDAEAIPVLLVVLVAGLVLSSLFVVWTAPMLFAELLLDGVLAAGLYRRLRHIETRHWLQTALRKTAWPFVLTAALLTAVGFGLQAAMPHADSIGDVLRFANTAIH